MGTLKKKGFLTDGIETLWCNSVVSNTETVLKRWRQKRMPFTNMGFYRDLCFLFFFFLSFKMKTIIRWHIQARTSI